MSAPLRPGSTAPLRPGSTVGEYTIEAEIGRGGMGVVYRARHERLDRPVALKVIAPELAGDPTFRGRFDRESRLAAAIEHPHAVPLYEAGEADGVVFIAMRLVEGDDLRSLLRSQSWLEPERAATLIDQVAGALDAAHELGLVHRDVKPGNVLIGEAGGREWAYLTDFGLTKSATEATALTESGKWMGTADYASPEQIQGKELDARSDVYSLGCVLYEALTGRIPFERDEPVAKLYAHVNDPPPTVSEAIGEPAPSLDAVVSRALAKRPSDRFPSAGDLGRAALAAGRGDQPTVPERSVARGEAAPGSRAGPRPAATRPLSKLTGRLSAEAEDRSAWTLPLLSLGMLALIAAVVWVAISAFGGGDPGGGDPGEGEQVPPGIEVLEPIAVGNGPLGISVGEGFAWVTNEDDGTVSRIDAGSGEVEGKPIEVGDRPAGVRFGADAVWVANAGSGTVSRIDPRSFEVESTIKVGKRPTGVRVGAGSVWVANSGDDTVSRIDPGADRVTDTIPAGREPAGIAIDRGEIWVVNSGASSVSRVSVGSGEPAGEPVRVGNRPRGIVADYGSIWVTNSEDNSVSRASTTSGELQAEIPVREQPAQVMHEAGLIWVANQAGGSVSRIDPTTNKVIAGDIPVGSEPRGIAASEPTEPDMIWVVNSGDDTVSRIRP